MTPLERAEWQVRQCWYDLALAESQGQPAEVLQARYDRYIEALHSYLAAFDPEPEQEAS
jgi:hypothetical protein